MTGRGEQGKTRRTRQGDKEERMDEVKKQAQTVTEGRRVKQIKERRMK